MTETCTHSGAYRTPADIELEGIVFYCPDCDCELVEKGFAEARHLMTRKSGLGEKTIIVSTPGADPDSPIRRMFEQAQN